MSDLQSLISTLAKKHLEHQEKQKTKGYYEGKEVTPNLHPTIGDIHDQEKAEQAPIDAEAKRQADNEEGMRQAAAYEAMARSKSQQDGKLLYDNSLYAKDKTPELASPTPVLASTEQANEDGPNSTPPSDLMDKVQAAMQKSKAPVASRAPAATPDTTEESDTEETPEKKATNKDVAEKDEISTTSAAPKSSSAYGKGLEDSDLAASQDQARFLRLLGGLGNASSTVSSALSKGSAKDLEAGADTLKNADQSTKDILARREAADKATTREKLLSDLSNEKLASDPNSEISKALRDGLKMVLPTLNIPDGTSARELRSMGFNMGTMVSAKLASDTRKDVAEENRLAREASSSDKKDKKQQDNDRDFYKDVQSYRGNTAVAKAAQNVISAKNAVDLVQSKLDNPDPKNPITPQDGQLMTIEMLKMASGGVPGQHEIDKQSLSTVSTNIASAIQKLTGNPNDMGARNLIKHQLEYVKDIAKNNQDAVDNFQANVVRGHKGRASEEKIKEFLDENPNIGNIINKTKKSTTSISDEDKQAIEWAKDNKSDPRAQQILKMHGM